MLYPYKIIIISKNCNYNNAFACFIFIIFIIYTYFKFLRKFLLGPGLYEAYIYQLWAGEPF